MTQSLMSRDKSVAKKKGWLALAGWVGTGFIGVKVSFWLAIPAAVAAAYLTVNWFMFRAKRGMRF